MSKIDVRSYNEGNSDYARHKFQAWDFWLAFRLNPWDADMVKRLLRTKSTDNRMLDYKKIKHICLERKRQLKNNEDIFPVNLEPKNINFGEMIDDYDLTNQDIIMLLHILYPRMDDRVADYDEIIFYCNERIKELEKESD